MSFFHLFDTPLQCAFLPKKAPIDPSINGKAFALAASAPSNDYHTYQSMSLKRFLELEKKTTSGLYLDNLTGIRGLAVLWVLLLHTWSVSGGSSINLTIPFTDIEVGITRNIRMGEWGVDIFFVLSGFLLSMPFLKSVEGAPFWERTLMFYKRRALRLLPAFYFTLLVLLYMLMFGFGKIPSPTEMVQHVLLGNIFFGTPALRGAFWSLPVEAHFYVVLPFFLVIAFRCKSFIAFFIYLVFLTIAFRVAILNTTLFEPKGAYLFSFLGRVDQFSIGILCAHLFLNKPLSARRGNIITILSIIGFIVFIGVIGHRGNMFEKRDPFYYFFQSVVALLAAALIYGAASPSEIARRLFGNRLMIFIGTISYSMYLWHTIILDIFAMSNLAHGLTEENKLISTILYTWPPILLISFFSYISVERPFLKIRHDYQNQPESFISKYPIYFLCISAAMLVALTMMCQQIYKINH
ncbi:acyltransferase [Delftia acidovorans]|uniref:acyltransferase family protein n=1 Tax=Delftia acidovorans TaxID=80866 RepID=UPI0018D7D58D|nr:acyltransferase [Delftia acidovorans]QPR35716.1 acyltransferase [Delftia acidovorans]